MIEPMNGRIPAIALVAICLSGCGTSQVRTDDFGSPLDRAIESAFLEKGYFEGRSPSQSQSPETNENFAGLRKVSPGRFQVFVFPKLNSLTAKTNVNDEKTLGPPQAFEVSVIAENPCKQFISKNLQGKLHPESLFDQNLQNEDRRCAIIEITDLKVKSLPRGLIRPGDILTQRIFLDDKYQSYGHDILMYGPRKTIEMTRFKTNAMYPLTSGLTLFPIDFPNFDHMSKTQFKTIDLKSEGLDALAINQIKKRYLKSFSTQQCQGFMTQYRDSFGQKVKVGWCKTSPWPTFTENDRFFSVTQQLTTR